jgi:hypothetical protein
VGAAAGGGVAVAFVNPALGAVVGPAAQATTEQLLEQMLPAQQKALDELLERTRGMESLLGEVRSSLQSLVDGPWNTALLHIEDAENHPLRSEHSTNYSLPVTRCMRPGEQPPTAPGKRSSPSSCVWSTARDTTASSGC